METEKERQNSQRRNCEIRCLFCLLIRSGMERIMKLVCSNLCKRYSQKIIYNNASIQLEEGKIYGLLGRNGIGKTTFLNCLSGLDSFDAGEVLLHTEEQTRKLEAEDVGYVLAAPALPDFMTGYEFIQFYMDMNPAAAKGDASYYMELVKLSKEDQNRLIRDYSLGMKNKLQLLMPMIAQPKIILLDEPLTSFDVVVAEEIKQLLNEMKRDKIILFSTHIWQLAQELCSQLILVHDHQLELLDEQKSIENSKEEIMQKLQE